MKTATLPRVRRTPSAGPYFVFHPSFEEPTAEMAFGEPLAEAGEELTTTHLADDDTRELARRMHYAAYRASEAVHPKQERFWQNRYYACRDRIVLGNRKLVFRAVRRWMPAAHLADDMIGDCQIVLIQAVAAYNPWLGIRFSTYVFTCLMRALSRLSQRQAADRLARSLPLEALPDGEPRSGAAEERPSGSTVRIDEYLREDHSLLSSREKMVLLRRFSLAETQRGGTLEQVGRELGLSKERVRQVQASALGKLRKALLAAHPTC